MMREEEEEKEEEDDFVVKVDLSDEDVRSGGEEGREGEMEGVGDQKSKGDTATRSHEPPDDQPSTSSLPSMECEHSLGLPDDKTSMDIPASSIPTMPPLRPTHI